MWSPRLLAVSLAFLGLGALTTAASAQTFRGFAGYTDQICEASELESGLEGESGQQQMLLGGSLGRASRYYEMNLGVITHNCSVEEDGGLLISGSMNLFPINTGSFALGVAVNADWDIPQMESTFRAQGEGVDVSDYPAWLFFRPELVGQAFVYTFGDNREEPDGMIAVEARGGQFRHRSNYLTVGLVLYFIRM